jgi:hypothetical protein
VTPERTVDWTLQIDVAGHPAAQRAKRIDSRLPPALIALPTQISGSEPGTDYASLANRDLQRGQAVGLASGEAIARHLEVPPLTAAQLGLAEHGWTGETPLWLYILKEAEVLHAGERLGPVGARVVGEVLVGIIDSDPESFRSVDPVWQPTLPGRRAGSFGLADILGRCRHASRLCAGAGPRPTTRAFREVVDIPITGATARARVESGRDGDQVETIELERVGRAWKISRLAGPVRRR